MQGVCRPQAGASNRHGEDEEAARNARLGLSHSAGRLFPKEQRSPNLRMVSVTHTSVRALNIDRGRATSLPAGDAITQGGRGIEPGTCADLPALARQRVPELEVGKADPGQPFAEGDGVVLVTRTDIKRTRGGTIAGCPPDVRIILWSVRDPG